MEKTAAFRNPRSSAPWERLGGLPVTKWIFTPTLCGLALLMLATGCNHKRNTLNTPVRAGLNTNNLIDPVAQAEADQLGDAPRLMEIANKFKRVPTPEQVARRRSVLCLSG